MRSEARPRVRIPGPTKLSSRAGSRQLRSPAGLLRVSPRFAPGKSSGSAPASGPLAGLHARRVPVEINGREPLAGEVAFRPSWNTGPRHKLTGLSPWSDPPRIDLLK
jgi:hypothetical protein